MTHSLHVRIRDLRRQFDGRPILAGLSLDIAAGEFVVVVGESGGGKSTLLRILAGLDTGFEGQRQVVDPVAVAFQDARLVPWKRVWQNVIFGLDGSSRELRERSLAALAEVGLQARADQWPHTLSGGESQRVALARSLIREPRLLLLDEPLGALDALTRLRMQSLLRGLWQRHGFAVLLITHDIDEAIALAQRVLVLSGGRFVDEIAIPARRDDPVLLQQLRERILARLHIVDFV